MILAYITIAVVTFILYVKWRQTYWQRKGIPFVKPEFLFGNVRKAVTSQDSVGETNLTSYRELKKMGATKHGGKYSFWQPIYMPMDPNLIKQILHKDFKYFMDHGAYHHPKDILTMHVFNLEGEKWKDLRAKLTPTFTSGKLKMMFETLLEKAEVLEKKVGNYAASHEPFAIKEISSRFSTDIIASCAFGIECNSLEEPDNIFRKYGKKVFEPNLLRFWIRSIVPWTLLANLGFKGSGLEVTNFFSNVVKETIKIREAEKIVRKDFMHLLLQLKNLGVTSDSAKITTENNKTKQLLSEDEIIAQCFIFYLGGFETSSGTMTFTLLELAQNLDIQEKLRQEITSILAKYDGKITYDAVMEMSYLTKVFDESLRKFPIATELARVCTRTYRVPDTNVVIEKGTKVGVPVWGIHMDPQYYPNPDVFDPERFSEENKASRPDFTYLPFGEGPRKCIALRFGVLQTKVGLVSLIKNFKFTLNKKTALPIKMEGTLVMSVKGDVWLDVTKI